MQTPIKIRIPIYKNDLFSHFNYEIIEINFKEGVYSFGSCRLIGKEYKIGHPTRFTGLLDSKLNEVYEGDKVVDDISDYEYLLVVWNKQYARYQLDGYGYAITTGEGSQEVESTEISLIDENVFELDCMSEMKIVGNQYTYFATKEDII